MPPRTTKKKLVKVVDIIASPNFKKVRKVLTRNLSEEIQEEVQEGSFDQIKNEALKEFERPKDTKSFKEENRLDRVIKDDSDFDLENDYGSSNKTKLGKKFLFGIVGIVLLVIIGYVAFAVLPEVDVRIVAQKTDAQLSKDIIVNKNTTSFNVESSQVPGEIISKNKTTVVKILASGKKYLEQRATGVITIVNNYSVSAQPLVVNTRFETPDGKIFRLVTGVTVPGAKKVGNELEPSTIDAKVVADKPGVEYNIDAVNKFTIPGFKGSEKYKGFYGMSDAPMSGGFVGEGASVSQVDIDKAKQGAKDSLMNSILTEMKLDLSQDSSIKLLDGAYKFNVLKEQVDPVIDADGKFTISLEGELSAIVFKETDILGIFKGLLVLEKNIDPQLKEKEYSLAYMVPVVDWKNGKMTISTTYNAKLWYDINIDELKSKIAGMGDVKLKQTIMETNGIEKISVSYWPFYVSNVPKKVSKINLSVE